MSKNLLVPLAVSLLFLGNARGQESGVCADVPGQTSGTRRFVREGEVLRISLRGDVKGAGGIDGVGDVDGTERGAPAGFAGCEPVALGLHWSNGRNNGSNFNLTFLDSTNKPIYMKSFSGFLAGTREFDLSSGDFQRVYASSMTVVSVPVAVTIQAVSPFAAPVSLSYTVTRVAKPRGKGEEGNRVNGVTPSRTEGESEAVAGGRSGEGSPRGQPAGGAGRQEDKTKEGNEVVSIRNVVRLIGASKLPVVQIELRTAHPFPIKDAPLQLQIGKKVFVDELSGDFTGRRLTLILTPEMFAELNDGDEIVASFVSRDGNEAAGQGVWNFGKLVKNKVE